MRANQDQAWFEVAWVAATETQSYCFRMGNQRYLVTGRLAHGEQAGKLMVAQLQMLTATRWKTITAKNRLYYDVMAQLREGGKIV